MRVTFVLDHAGLSGGVRVVAIYAATLGSLIEVVNRFGSFFYGSILGVFLLAMVPRAGGWGAFLGLLAGMTVVGVVNFGTDVAYLWQNLIGAVVVLAVGVVVGGGGATGPAPTPATPPD